MALVVKCTCGQRLQLRPEHAGQVVACPHCGAKLKTPAQPTAGQAARPTPQIATQKPAQTTAQPAARKPAQPVAGKPAQRPAQAAVTAQSATAEKMQVSCKCGVRLSIGKELIGRTVACPKCKTSFVVPAPQSTTQPRQPAPNSPAAAPRRPPTAAPVLDDDPLGLGQLSAAHAAAPQASTTDLFAPDDDPLGLESYTQTPGSSPQPMPGYAPSGQPANVPAPMPSATYPQPYTPRGYGHAVGGRSSSTNMVRTGMLIVAIALCVLAGCIGLMLLGTAIMQLPSIMPSNSTTIEQAQSRASSMFTIMKVGNWVRLAGVLLALLPLIGLLVGYGLCATRPGIGRLLMIAALVCILMHFGLDLVAIVLNISEPKSFEAITSRLYFNRMVSVLISLSFAAHLLFAAGFVFLIGREYQARFSFLAIIGFIGVAIFVAQQLLMCGLAIFDVSILDRTFSLIFAVLAILTFLCLFAGVIALIPSYFAARKLVAS